jgi:hypothetical protein
MCKLIHDVPPFRLFVEENEPLLSTPTHVSKFKMRRLPSRKSKDGSITAIEMRFIEAENMTSSVSSEGFCIGMISALFISHPFVVCCWTGCMPVIEDIVTQLTNCITDGGNLRVTETPNDVN